MCNPGDGSVRAKVQVDRNVMKQTTDPARVRWAQDTRQKTGNTGTSNLPEEEQLVAVASRVTLEDVWTIDEPSNPCHAQTALPQGVEDSPAIRIAGRAACLR
eukprot:scaffold1401_cov330-Pavlova_lutheri.AAC.104